MNNRLLLQQMHVFVGLLVCGEIAVAQGANSTVEARSDTFACASLEDAKSVAERLQVNDGLREKELVASHSCVVIHPQVPWQVQSADGAWVLISVPGLPNAAEWSPRDAFVPLPQ